MSFDREDFAGNLRSLRARLHLTQAAVAEATNITPSSLSNFEKGLTIPNLETVCILADFYGVTLDQIAFFGDRLKGSEKDD